jgi:hypothetical protein
LKKITETRRIGGHGSGDPEFNTGAIENKQKSDAPSLATLGYSSKRLSRSWWLVPVILAIWEAKIRRIVD